MRSKTHEPVLFERSEFTGECAELLTESRELYTAARRCGGTGGIGGKSSKCNTIGLQKPRPEISSQDIF